MLNTVYSDTILYSNMYIIHNYLGHVVISRQDKWCQRADTWGQLVRYTWSTNSLDINVYLRNVSMTLRPKERGWYSTTFSNASTCSGVPNGIDLASVQVMVWLICQYSQISNISRTLVDNKIVDDSDALEHRLSALLQLHLHSRLNTWLQWIGQIPLQDDARNI